MAWWETVTAFRYLTAIQSPLHCIAHKEYQLIYIFFHTFTSYSPPQIIPTSILRSMSSSEFNRFQDGSREKPGPQSSIVQIKLYLAGAFIGSPKEWVLSRGTVQGDPKERRARELQEKDIRDWAPSVSESESSKGHQSLGFFAAVAASVEFCGVCKASQCYVTKNLFLFAVYKAVTCIKTRIWQAFGLMGPRVPWRGMTCRSMIKLIQDLAKCWHPL